MSEREPFRLVRVSPELMAVWATRTDDGRTLTVEWGNPGEDGFYEPTFRVSGSTEAERLDLALRTRDAQRAVDDYLDGVTPGPDPRTEPR